MGNELDLRAWAEDDYWLLQRTVGDPAMTKFLGGPESDEKMRSRHEKYLAMNGSESGQMFVIVAGKDQTPVGTHGFWEKDWQNEIVWEIGWFVLPEFQRRGIATIDSKCQTSTASCMPILPVKMSLPMQFATNWVFRYAEKLISNIPKAIG